MARDGERIDLGSKVLVDLRKGDRLVMTTGSGAGYGRPEERSSALRERDRRLGFVSPV